MLDAEDEENAEEEKATQNEKKETIQKEASQNKNEQNPQTAKDENKVIKNEQNGKKCTHKFGEFYQEDDDYIYEDRYIRKVRWQREGFTDLELIAAEIFFHYQAIGFYSDMEFKTFYEDEFKKGLKNLERFGVSVNNYEDGNIIFIALRNYFRIFAMQDAKITWWRSRTGFATFCANNWEMFAVDKFNIAVFLKYEGDMTPFQRKVAKDWDKNGKLKPVCFDMFWAI